MTAPGDGRHGAVIERENPSRATELVGRVVVSGPDRVDALIRRADAAQRGWAATGIARRLATLAAGADAIAGRLEPLAELLARESGKVLADCRGEVGFAATYLRWVVEHAPAAYAEREIDDAAGRLLRLPRPYGVVAAITPWNAPIILTLLKVAPALAAGNAVVVKPSPLAPLAVSEALHLLTGALPDGMLAVVHGDAAAGAALVGHPLVRKVAFTGGGVAARQVAATAATQTTPVVLELGGNDAAIFLPDADLGAEPMHRLVAASFATSGQVCMAAKRLYVHRSRRDEFVAAYRSAAAEVLRVGDALTPGVSMGPVISAGAAARIERIVAAAVARGATAMPLGTVDSGTDLAGGYFVAPTLVLDAPDDAEVIAGEQFGPTVPLLLYDDEEELLARVNADELGLGGSVWSVDEERAFALARRVEAGFVFVNTHNRTGLSLRAPFGGVKRSGYGREYAEEGLAEYVQTCVVHSPGPFRPGGAGLPANAYPR